MGTKDITEKQLEEWNDVFADIVNVLLFNGDRLVKEKELEDDAKDTMIKADGKVHEQERDVSKFWKNGEIRISILGLENQTVQDSTMPLRVISYDGASYKQQLLDKKHPKKYPVVTLVLYFGTDTEWTAPTTLYDCFEIPERLKPYVSDYKINVFNIAFLSDSQIDMFQSDFKFVAQYFQSKRQNKKYEGSDEEIHHVDELLKLFAALTGDNRFESMYNKIKVKSAKGGIGMGGIFSDIYDEGMSKGRASGLAEGRTEGQSDVIRKMLDAKALTVEQIADILKLSVAEVQKIADTVPAQA